MMLSRHLLTAFLLGLTCSLLPFTGCVEISIKENAKENSEFKIKLGAGEKAGLKVSDGAFTLSPDGTLRVATKLDYETKKGYTYVMEIQSGSKKREEELKIKIEDINDEAPQIVRPFNSPFYKNGLPENMTAVLYNETKTLDGAVVYCVQATDKDTTANLTFDFSSKEDMAPQAIEYFRIVPKLGCIVRQGNTDLPPNILSYTFPVRVTDENSEVPEKTHAYTLVRVYLNFRPPQIAATPYVITFKEKTEAGTKIGTIHAIPLNYVFGPLKWEVTPRKPFDANWPFTLNVDTGEMTVKEKFSFHTTCKREWHADVKVTQTLGGKAYIAETQLYIVLTDTDDFRPFFEETVYFTKESWPENVSADTTLLSVSATDPDDPRTNLKYNLTGTGSDKFTITTDKSGNGIIKRATGAKLDYESLGPDHAYKFQVTVADTKPETKATASVVIYVNNVNDEIPLFKSATLKETARINRKSVNEVVYQADASDADGSGVSFYFLDGSTRKSEMYNFKITKENGAVLYAAEEKNGTITFRTLTIIAVDDKGCMPKATCIKSDVELQSSKLILTVEFIDRNTQAPKFTNCPPFLEFPESRSIGDTLITLSAEDKDLGVNGIVIYELQKNQYSPDPERYVKVETVGGNGILKLARKVDHEDYIEKFEGLSNVWITVMARDNGIPGSGSDQLKSFCTMRMKVTDVNDNPPQFDDQTYITGIKRKAYNTNDKIVQVFAYDPDQINTDNSKVVYEKGKNFPSNFQLKQDGWISFSSSVTEASLKYEKFEVTARNVIPLVDTTKKPTATATVEVFVVDRDTNLPPLVAPDFYNNVDISMKESDPITKSVKTGTVSLPGSTNLIDMNHIAMSGDTRETNKGLDFFNVYRNRDSSSFAIRPVKILDASEISHVYLRIRFVRTKVRYTRPGETVGTAIAYTDVRLLIRIVDVNNRDPSFILFRYESLREISVPENEKFTRANGRPVASLFAADKDVLEENWKVTYHVTDASNKFEAFGDKLYMKDSASLDYESKDKSYDLVVTANNTQATPHRTVQVSIVIKVSDVNDIPPRFTKTTYSTSVQESQPVGRTFYTLTAIDDDEVNNKSLVYSIRNTGVPFAVVANTGDVYASRPLDSEEKKEYTLNYYVFDGKVSANTELKITVLDVNDNAPKFKNAVNGVINAKLTVGSATPTALSTVELIDNDTGAHGKTIVSVSGMWTKNPFRYFSVTQSGPKYELQALNSNLDPAKNNLPTNKYRFTLEASEGSLTSYAQVVVDVVNTKNVYTPCFNLATLNGWRVEGENFNMVLKAFDRDNNPMNFSLVKPNAFYDVNTDGTVKAKDPNSGKAGDKLVAMEVAVSDGDKKATAMATVTIIPKNTKPPGCLKKPYKVKLYDDTAVGKTFYAILPKDLEEADRRKLKFSSTNDIVGIRTLPELDAGGLYLKKPIPTSISNFNITIQDQKFISTCTISVEILNGNANDPVVTFTPTQVSVPETAGTVGILSSPISMTKIKVTDKDKDDKSFTFAVKSISVGSKTVPNPGIELKVINGAEAELLRVKDFDREKLTTGSGSAVVDVVITANDQRWKYRTSTATFTVTVTDQAELPALSDPNDAYVDSTKDTSPVLTSTGSQKIAVSPPSTNYQFAGDTTSPIWSSKAPLFTLTDDGKTFSLKSTNALKAETAESLKVPVVVKDGTGKTLSTVTVTVGLQNGKLPNTNKEIRATVSFGWSWYWTQNIRPMAIGLLYGRTLYGNDAVGVAYALDKNPYTNYFSLNTTTGMLFVVGPAPTGDYTLSGTVKRGSLTAKASVNIHVTAVGPYALHNVATLVLSNTDVSTVITRTKKTGATGTSKDSYNPNILDRIKSVIAKAVPTEASKVVFVSLEENRAKRTVNVYYVASGSPYYSAPKLNMLMAMNKAELEKIPGVKVSGTVVDKCAEEPEKCPNGCVNRISVDQSTADKHLKLTNTFVGLQLRTTAVCGCELEKSVSPVTICDVYTCLNNGNCSIFPGTQTAKCSCPDRYEGPRCQKLDVNFATANGYLFTDPVGSCGQFHINFQFVTSQTEALLLYTGPVTEGKTEDFMAVKLVGGIPVIDIRIGSKALTVGNTNQMKTVNDRKWHRLDIWYKDGTLEFMVDRCMAAPVLPLDGSSSPNRSICYVKAEVVASTLRPSARRLNVAAVPLQVGGSNLQKAYPNGLIGSIRLLRVNGELRNLLGDKRAFGANMDTNKAMIEACYGTDNKPICGVNAICRPGLDKSERQCVCKPGYRKDTSGKCTETTKVKDYNKAPAYTYWKLKSTTNKVLTRASIRFRTRQTHGSLLLLVGADYVRNQSLEIRLFNSRVELVHNIGDFLFASVIVPNTNVSDGEWHTIEFSRILNSYELLLDGGDIGNYIYYQGSLASIHNYMTLNKMVLSGIRFKWRNPHAFQYEYAYAELTDTCVTDVRFDDSWMPLSESDNGNSIGVSTVDRQRNRIDNCNNTNVCPSTNTCPSPLICVKEIWRPLTKPSCSCALGYAYITGLCVAVGQCSPNPCVNGVCVIDSTNTRGFVCVCPKDYRGTRCEQLIVAAAGLGAGLIVLIVICILLILIALLFYVYWSRCRRRDDKLLDYPDEDTRENVVTYDEEGAGEEDKDDYDLTHLRKPIHNDIQPHYARPLKSGNPRNNDLGNFLDGRLQDAENDPHGPPQDYSLDYGYEGQGSVADDLSSLGSGTSDGSQQYDHLNSMGPKFRPLSNLYNNHRSA